MAEIKALIVDYGGVLVEQVSTSDNVARIAQGIGIDPIQLKEGIYGKNRELWNRAKLGLISEAEHWAEVAINLHLPAEQIHLLKYQFFEIPKVHTSFVNFLKTLQGRYLLAILSNAIPVFSKTWETLGFFDLFDVTINSSLVKLAKPDPEIYQLTVQRLNLSPEVCILVDDQLKNLSAASRLGFQVVHFLDCTQAIESINKFIGKS